MKRLLPVLMGFALLLLSSTEGWSLPPCPGSPAFYEDSTKSWTDCIGTYTDAKGILRKIKYVGEWKDGKKHGHGTFTRFQYFQHGQYTEHTYVGEFSDGEKNGKGTSTVHYPSTPDFRGGDGPKYVGEFRWGKKWGQGTYIYADGRKYVGEYKDNKEHRQGIRYLADGKVFQEGMFENGKFIYAKKLSPKNNAKQNSGSKKLCAGTYKSTWNNCIGLANLDEEEYVGGFKNGSFHGQGTYTFADGEKYVGEFKYDQFNGQGTYYYPGSTYVGEWKDDEENGHGTLTFANGNKYIGQWKDGRRHGQGTLKHWDGTIQEGIWENDQFKSVRE